MIRTITRQHSRPRMARNGFAAAGSRMGAVLLCVVLAGGAAAGCSAPAPELGVDAAKALQARVLAVTEAAAADDPANSLKLLDELGTELDQAAAGGDVSVTRHQKIRSAIDAVRTDLAALQAAAEAARLAAEQAAAEKAAAEQAAAEQAAQAAAAAAAAAAPPPPPVVAPAPAPADTSKNKGKGQDNGKGQGKG